jgi:signal transduction histidine kinase
MEELASISVELRPSSLDDLGLVNTLRWFGGEFQNIYPHIHLDHEITIQEDEVPENLKIVIFRVIQEGLNNVAKHSNAGSVRLSLDKKDGAIELDIHDTGTGFDPNSRHVRIDSSKGLGLGSMRERTELSGGSFAIESIPGKGTIIRAVWPERVLH